MHMTSRDEWQLVGAGLAGVVPHVTMTLSAQNKPSSVLVLICHWTCCQLWQIDGNFSKLTNFLWISQMRTPSLASFLIQDPSSQQEKVITFPYWVTQSPLWVAFWQRIWARYLISCFKRHSQVKPTSSWALRKSGEICELVWIYRNTYYKGFPPVLGQAVSKNNTESQSAFSVWDQRSAIWKMSRESDI